MDDDKPDPNDDAPHVTSLDEITGDGPVLWTADGMVAQGGGAIFAIPDDGARGQWREPWASAEDGPMHMLRVPIVTRPTVPTDAEIVALMKLRGNGSREQPRSSGIGTPVGLAWHGEAIPESDAQAAWDRFHESEMFKAPPPRVVDLAGGRSPFPAAAHPGCPRCHSIWEVSGYAWQFECKCRRWRIDVNGRESWEAIPGAPLYCCGREMERAATARQYGCACGRGASRRIDEWLIASMEKLMRDCEIAGTPFDKHRLFMFSAGTGTGATPGPEHGHAFTFADYSAARSRVLAAKVAASDAARAEAARRVVLGPIDDESEA